MFDHCSTTTGPSGITSRGNEASKSNTFLVFFLPLSSTFFFHFVFVFSSSHCHTLLLSPHPPHCTSPTFLYSPPPPTHMYNSTLGTCICLCCGDFLFVFVCMVWVLLKPCCCLRPRQCPAFAAQWGWTGSLWPHQLVCLSPPTTSLIVRPCRTTTLKAAMTCCPTVTWRGRKMSVFRVKPISLCLQLAAVYWFTGLRE